MINNIVLIGRLAGDVNLRYTPNGKANAAFDLAVQRNFTNKDGGRDADFIPVVVWGAQAESCANHLAKGRMVAVEGRLQTRSYETSEGQRRKVYEVVANTVQFLEWNGKQDAGYEVGDE